MTDSVAIVKRSFLKQLMLLAIVGIGIHVTVVQAKMKIIMGYIFIVASKLCTLAYCGFGLL